MQPNSAKPSLGPVLFLTAVFFINFTSRSIVGPLLPPLEEALDMTHTQSGSLFFFRSVGGFISLVGSGFFSAHVSYHRTIIVSMVCLAFGCLCMGLSNSYAALSASFVIMGLAAGLYLPSAIAVMRNILPGSMLSRAMAVHEIAPNLGFLVAPLLVEFVLVMYGWRAAFFTAAGACLAAGLFWGRFGRGGNFKAHIPDLASILKTIGRLSTWILGALFSIGLTIEVTIYNMLPLFLTSEKSMELSEANYLLAASRIPALVVMLSIGWLSDRMGWQRTLAWTLAISGAVTILLGLGPDSWAPVLVVLQAVGASAFWPPALAALATAGDAKTKALVVSGATAISSIVGMGLIPTGIGAMADMGLFPWAIASAGILSLLGLLLLHGIRQEREPAS